LVRGTLPRIAARLRPNQILSALTRH
jgi:hypothetical protein